MTTIQSGSSGPIDIMTVAAEMNQTMERLGETNQAARRAERACQRSAAEREISSMRSAADCKLVSGIATATCKVASGVSSLASAAADSGNEGGARRKKAGTASGQSDTGYSFADLTKDAAGVLEVITPVVTVVADRAASGHDIDAREQSQLASEHATNAQDLAERAERAQRRADKALEHADAIARTIHESRRAVLQG